MASPVQKISSSESTRSVFRAVLQTARPHQWIKNLLCFVPVVFTRNLDKPELIVGASLAVLAFCLASSAVYLFNDLRDREMDRAHPTKRLRPIASGELSIGSAVFALCSLTIAALVVALFCNLTFFALIAFYLVQNVAYTCGLKRIVILDVMMVANGFLLRAAGGAFAINVTASPWLVLCTLTLALLVAFGKRRHELRLVEDASVYRRTLIEYSAEFLDQSMSMAAASAMVMYSLFTLSQYALTTYGSQALVLSVPMVMYAVFRFVFLVRQQELGGDPTRMFVTDKAMLVNGILWVAVCIYAIYGPSEWLPWWRMGYFDEPTLSP